jgi:hypothetical protein
MRTITRGLAGAAVLAAAAVGLASSATAELNGTYTATVGNAPPATWVFMRSRLHPPNCGREKWGPRTAPARQYLDRPSWPRLPDNYR